MKTNVGWKNLLWDKSSSSHSAFHFSDKKRFNENTNVSSFLWKYWIDIAHLQLGSFSLLPLFPSQYALSLLHKNIPGRYKKVVESPSASQALVSQPRLPMC